MKKEEIKNVIYGYYAGFLGRIPAGWEVEHHLRYVESQDDHVKALIDTLQSFITSKEFSIKSIPVMNLECFVKNTNDKKIAIYGTGEKSRELYLLLLLNSHFTGVVKFFVEKEPPFASDFCGLTVKQFNATNDIDVIAIPDAITTKAVDDIFMQEVLYQKAIRCYFCIEEESNFLMLPYHERMDSVRFLDFLDKKITLISQGETGAKLYALINELNYYFTIAFEQSIIIENVIKAEELPTFYWNNNIKNKIWIAQDENQEQSLDFLFFKEVKVDDISIIKFSNIQDQLSDLFFKPNGIFVYTMTKVGTISIVSTLKANNFCVGVAHYLSLLSVNQRKKIFMDNSNDTMKQQFLSMDSKEDRYFNWNHYLDTAYISNYILNKNISNKLLIITGTRDSISQAISKYFQSMDMNVTIGLKVLDDNLEKVLNEVNDYILCELSGPDWFENEFKRGTGINIFDYPFAFDKGYQIIDNDQVRILVYRLEDLSRVWTEAIKDFLGEDKLTGLDVKLHIENEASNKQISLLYKKVKQNIKFEEKVVDEIYSSKYMQHFYSDEERAKFKENWIQRSHIKEQSDCSELYAIIELKENYIQEQRGIIEQKENYIQEQRGIIEQKENYIQEQRDIIEQKENYIQEQRDIIEQKDYLIQKLDERIGKINRLINRNFFTKSVYRCFCFFKT